MKLKEENPEVIWFGEILIFPFFLLLCLFLIPLCSPPNTPLPISLPFNLRISVKTFRRTEEMCQLEGRKRFDNQVCLSAKVAASNSNGLYATESLFLKKWV